MSLARVRLPERIEAAGAVVLLLALFLLDWYGESITGLLPGSHISVGTVSATGWEVFTNSRWIWLVTVLVALGAGLAATAAYRPEGPVQLGAVVFGMGVLSSVLIVYRVIYHPGANADGHGIHVSYGIKAGIWLGLLAALAIMLGGYMQLRAEGGAPSLPTPERKPRPPAEPPSEAPEQAFSGLTVAEREPGAGSPPSERTP